MTKIIIGVAGEGMGHASRCDILINHLKKKHELRIFAGNRAYKFLKSRHNNVVKIESLNISYKDNKVIILDTIWNNLIKQGRVMRSYLKIRQALKKFKPDVIMSDFEPLTNYVALFSSCKHINLNNQNDINYEKSNVKPEEFLSFRQTRDVTRLFTTGADVYFIYSLDPKKNSKKIKYVGNLINPRLQSKKPTSENHVFVYQSSKSNNKLLHILGKLDEKFIIYGYNKISKKGNLVFRKFNDDVYYKDFCSAKAVIAGGGLTTIAESIYLKKPILSIPIKGQFEQTFNGKSVERLGFGKYLKDPNFEQVYDFLHELDKYKLKFKKRKNMSNKEILSKIDKVIN